MATGGGHSFTLDSSSWFLELWSSFCLYHVSNFISLLFKLVGCLHSSNVCLVLIFFKLCLASKFNSNSRPGWCGDNTWNSAPSRSIKAVRKFRTLTIDKWYRICGKNLNCIQVTCLIFLISYCYIIYITCNITFVDSIFCQLPNYGTEEPTTTEVCCIWLK